MKIIVKMIMMKMPGAVILGLFLVSLPLPTEAFFHQRKALVMPGALVGIVGSSVRSSDGQEIGKIKQLLVNPEDGELTYAVVAHGGILGFGEEFLAIPWADVEVGGDAKQVVLTVDREVLQKATPVEEGKDFNIKGRDPRPISSGSSRESQSPRTTYSSGVWSGASVMPLKSR